MGTFNTQKLLNGDPVLIPTIASRIESTFLSEGFDVLNQSLLTGAVDISISKGGVFKSVLGLKTALKITLKPQGGRIYFDASVGLFGQQVIPTIIMLFFAWPVVITQIWGLVQQSHLDDKALNIAEAVILENTPVSSGVGSNQETKYCVQCGSKIPSDVSFCPQCGTKQI